MRRGVCYTDLAEKEVSGDEENAEEVECCPRCGDWIGRVNAGLECMRRPPGFETARLRCDINYTGKT